MISLIKRFGRDLIITRNATAVVFVDGYVVNPVGDTTLTVRASIQPATSEDLEHLSEGSDTKEALKLYTITKLLPRQGNPSKKGDFFTVNNKKYEVVSVEDHTSHIALNIFYYKIIGLRVSYDA